MDRYIRWAEARNDARGMLFGAFQLRASNRTHAMELLDRAVARDPKLAWAYLEGAWEAAEDFDTPAWRERAFRYADLAIAHAPDNATGYLIKAELVRRATLGRDLAAHTGKGLDRLAATPEWIALMRKAAAQPRFDTYAMDLYRLQAKIWREQHWDTFLLGSWQLAGYSIPSAANLVDYDSLVTEQFGPALERTGKAGEARAMYLEVARLGQQMQLNPGSLIVYLVGLRLTRDAVGKLQPLVDKRKEPGLAQFLEFSRRSAEIREQTERGAFPMDRTAFRPWQILLINLFALLTLFFFVASVIVVFYVNLKRHLRLEVHGRLFQWMTVSENYLPIILFVSCLSLFVAYVPYSQNFHHYMDDTAWQPHLENFFQNAVPVFTVLTTRNTLPMANPFAEYLRVATIVVALTVALSVFLDWWAGRASR